MQDVIPPVKCSGNMDFLMSVNTSGILELNSSGYCLTVSLEDAETWDVGIYSHLSLADDNISKLIN
ncbi:hypothetical protein EAM01S_16_00420 [Erwinia amylovora NBRC 12687 = CFBP 1232]|nr:hypothetical protein EAM01S_16_00420 [Erwinia amylovora NBRC 12687 = CFBP 1232]